MISGTEWSGWYDQIRMRKGWSGKIGKWKWVTLQAVIPFILASPLMLVMLAMFEMFPSDEPITARYVLILSAMIMSGMAVANSGRWDEDQKQTVPVQRG